MENKTFVCCFYEIILGFMYKRGFVVQLVLFLILSGDMAGEFMYMMLY